MIGGGVASLIIAAVCGAAAALAPMRPVARVGLGAVALAPPKEFDRFLRRACLLVIEHGARGTLCVSLESPTLLTIGEAAEGVVTGALAARGRRRPSFFFFLTRKTPRRA